MTTEALGKNLLSYLPQFFGGEVGAVTRNNVPPPPPSWSQARSDTPLFVSSVTTFFRSAQS